MPPDGCMHLQRSPATCTTIENDLRAGGLAPHGEWRGPFVDGPFLCTHAVRHGQEAAEQRQRAKGAGQDHQDNRRAAEQER